MTQPAPSSTSSSPLSKASGTAPQQTARYERVALLGLAAVDGPDVVTSKEIEARLTHASTRLSLPLELLTEMTGIEERRLWPAGTRPSDIATAAARAALTDGGFDVADVDMVINASVCQDFVEPAGAAIVAGNLGVARSTLNFDVRNACLGFLTAIDVAAGMIESGRVRRALIVVAESSRPILEATIARLVDDASTVQMYRDQFVSLTLGSAGIGVVIGHVDEARRRSHRVRHSFWVAAPEHHALCVGNMDEMRVDAKNLTLQGLILGSEGFRAAAELFAWPRDHFPAYVMHQTSRTHLERFCDLIDVDSARFGRVYPRFGNVGAAGVGLALVKSAGEGRFVAGQPVPLLGIGSGLNAALVELTW
jgi:3-oxoacyl-[acyl-carrier-protein] synthase III